jgi:hypothetical protein
MNTTPPNTFSGYGLARSFRAVTTVDLVSKDFGVGQR